MKPTPTANLHYEIVQHHPSQFCHCVVIWVVFLFDWSFLLLLSFDSYSGSSIIEWILVHYISLPSITISNIIGTRSTAGHRPITYRRKLNLGYIVLNLYTLAYIVAVVSPVAFGKHATKEEEVCKVEPLLPHILYFLSYHYYHYYSI